MKKLLTTLTLLTLLAAPAHAHRSSARRSHAMTASEFRQVLAERDAARAVAWQRAEYEEEQAADRAANERLAAARKEGARLEKIEKAYHEAQTVLEENSQSPAFTAAQKKLLDECIAVDAPASPAAVAFIRHAWAAHRLNHP